VLQAPSSAPVIICPNRLYFDNFAVIRRVADECFEAGYELIVEIDAEKRRRSGTLTGKEVVVFGQGFSGEVGIQAPSSDEGSEGTFKMDFLLATVDGDLKPTSIVAIEVQTIDTTNSYSTASQAYYKGEALYHTPEKDYTPAGFNWENVSKRILPQLIYKGHALRREAKAQNGLYFILPHVVLEKIKVRVGGRLLQYPKGPGTITFHSYQVGPEVEKGARATELVEAFTTTVEQLAFAFVSPQNLPPLGIYEDTVGNRLNALSKRRRLD